MRRPISNNNLKVGVIVSDDNGFCAKVTELTEKGFKYEYFQPWPCIHPLMGSISGGECYRSGYDNWGVEQ